jgi:hypothetical protein
MHALKLIQIGGSLGVILPREAALRLKAESGGVIYLAEAADGYCLCSRDSAAGQIAAAGARCRSSLPKSGGAPPL